MSFATESSGLTDSLTRKAVQCFIPVQAAKAQSDGCCRSRMPSGPAATLPSMLLAARAAACRGPTPAEFAQYPKVAVPESVRVQNLANRVCDPMAAGGVNRFAQYNRYQPPVPCQPLPQEANMAGISKPSTRACNL
jgi:hypothetical protein